MTNAARVALVGIGLACGSACATPALNALRIEPTSTADSLVFLITAATGGPASIVYGLAVVTCNSGVVEWNIAADGSRNLPRDVTYGIHPPGFEVRVMPAPLRPGCHEAYVSDAPRIRFYVDPDRAVRSTP